MTGPRHPLRSFLAETMQDARIGARRLRQQPGFTLTAVLTLALGIGANAAMFSLVRGVLLEPLPYADPDRLALVWQRDGGLADDTWLSARELLEYRTSLSSFTEVAGYTQGGASLTDGEPERVRAAAVTANLFATLGVPAYRGRTFTVDEDVPGADDVVVIGHELWQRRFGGADVLGQDVRVSGRTRRIVGVMPPGFQLPLDYREERATEIWYPAALTLADDPAWGDRSYYVIGRLAPEVTHAQATRDLDRVLDGWVAAGHMTNTGGRLSRNARPLDDLLLGNVRPALLLLFGAVGLVLLIACANVMHLLLARGDARRREIATLAALGAGRGRIARRLLVESGLLGVAGATVGALLAWAGVRAVLAAMPINVIRTRDIAVDLPVLGFTALLALLATLAAGLAPALQLSGIDAGRTILSGRGDTAPMRRRVRRALVVAETALALVVVIAAALLARSFMEMRRIDPGFDPHNVLTARLELPTSVYPDDASTTAFYASVIERIEALPGVETAAAVRIAPLTATIGSWTITIEGRDAPPDVNIAGDWQVATPAYLETLRVPLLTGRYPTRADGPDAPLVAVVNRTMAERYWPGEDAVGRRFHLGTLDQPWVEVVGVIADVRHNAMIEEPRTEMVLLHGQWVRAKNGGSPLRGMTLVVRTTADPLDIVPAVREIVRGVDPSVPVADVRTLESIASTALAQPRFTAVLFAAFAALAMLLGAIGLYGVIAYTAARRTAELGIRLALGARPRSIVRLVMAEGLALAAVGTALGLPAAAAVANLLGSQLFGVSTLDPVTFVAVPLVLLSVAAAASFVPARRAAATSPLTALSTN